MPAFKARAWSRLRQSHERIGTKGRNNSSQRSRTTQTPVSLSENGDNNGPFAAANVALQMKDLLPGPEDGLSISNGHGQGWPEKCRLQMRMAVAVVPGLFVAIVAARRDQFVQDGRHVCAQPWLEFNGANRGGASHVEYVDDPRPDAGIRDSLGDLISEVVHVPMASGGD